MIATVVGPQLPHDPDQLRQAARELLSRPPFAEHTPGALERAIERGLDTVSAFIVRMLAAAGGDTAVAWTIVALGVALLAVAAWRIARGMVTDRSAAGDPTASSSGDTGEPAELALTGADPAAVLRAQYRRLLHQLGDTGLLAHPTSLTPREVVRLLAVDQPRLVDAVAPAARVVEEVSYAGRDASDADVAVVAAANRSLTVRRA